ncbi:MAG: CD225/dispanin family protein [Muribaculaceae bacterium]|nr:CD225/dispanin family protein [Muribaculaceae bacterium]
MVMAILTTLFCCLPLGIVAIIKASSVSSLWSQGRYDEARVAADEAGKWSKYALICGLVVIVIYILMMVAGVGIAAMR